MIAKVSALAIGMAINLIVSRHYGAETVGTLALLNSLIALISMLCMAGMQVSILRRVPEKLAMGRGEEASAFFYGTVAISTLVGVAVTVLLFPYTEAISRYLFDDRSISSLIVPMALSATALSLFTLSQRAVRALGHIKIFSLLQIATPVLNLFLLSTSAIYFYDPYNPIYTEFASFFIVSAISFYIVKKLFEPFSRSGDGAIQLPFSDIVSLSLPMFLSSAMSTVISQTDTLMLGLFLTQKDVGIYAIAFKLAVLAGFIQSAINTIAAPKFSHLYHSDDRERLASIAVKSTLSVLLISLPIYLSLLFFGREILSIFGDGFVPGYDTLAILCVGQLSASISGLGGTMLNMTGGEKVLRNITLAGALLNITLNLLLIPRFGIEGAAVAGSVALTLASIAILISVKRHLGFGMLSLSSIAR